MSAFSALWWSPSHPTTHLTIVRNWSIRGAWGTLFRGYFGSRGRRSVFGRWKDTEKRGLREECECTPCSAAFFASLAFVSFAEVNVSMWCEVKIRWKVGA